MSLIEILITAIWAMLPAYIPNNAAVIFGGGKPIDLGKKFKDNRLLGDGKTWKGSTGGILAGFAVSLALNSVNEQAQAITGINLPTFPLAVAILLPLGAILGDISASFVKRRINRERGSSLPFVDQLDFLVGSLSFVFLFQSSWTSEVFSSSVLLVILIITPILHVGTNFIGYKLDLKDEPW